MNPGEPMHSSSSKMSADILVIEDNPASMELMQYLLRARGHRVSGASDGEEGVAAARARRPDLVVCDVHLPRLDGYGVVQVLKGERVTASIPIVAVTALAMVGDREKLLTAGFDGYLSKPIEAENFASLLEAFLPVGAPIPAIRRDRASES